MVLLLISIPFMVLVVATAVLPLLHAILRDSRAGDASASNLREAMPAPAQRRPAMPAPSDLAEAA